MKGWLEKLNDPTRDVYERRYRLLSAVSIMTLLAWILFALAVDGYSIRILFFSICDLLFIPTMIITLRTGKIQIGAGGSGFVLVFLMIPFAFFFNGGIYAGAPNWCIMALVFITMTIRGKLRNFLLAADVAVTILCYVITWVRPDLVDEQTVSSAYVDSLASLIITGIYMAVMFLFQLHMANQERALMEKQQKEILELSQAQNRFFSSMSHEIRTPVNTIVGLNEMILREELSEEVKEDAEQVRSAGNLLLHLINDILDMSRLESGQMVLAWETYSLGDLLSETVGMMWMHAKEKDLEFHVDIDPQLPARLYGDAVRIKQILINILNNAVKYTQKGSVTLTVSGNRETEGTDSKKGYTLVFTVADTGQGIKKENLPYLFTAFKRVESAANQRIEGTGLGLSIVKQLVDRMGGTITVNSVYTKGSTFIVEIPQGDTGAEPIGERAMESRGRVGKRTKYVRRFTAPEARVLVVDDNASNRMVVTKLLRETGMQIDTAQDGLQALDMTMETAYDLVFMDHMMPVMDGITCLRQMRTQAGGRSRDAKVVALTANAETESRQLYAREGFDGYLLKPCTGEELENACLRLLPESLVQHSAEDGEILESSISWMEVRDRKEKIVITTDSIADLPDFLVKRYRIAMIPHRVHTEEGVFQDGLEIEPNGLVAYLDAGRGVAKTFPPTVEEYEAFFAAQLARADAVLHVSISKKISGSGYAPAKEAAAAFQNVTVFDSANLSSGEGLLVLEACVLAQEGRTPDQIAAKLEEEKSRIHSGFIVDSLDYLERAGLVKHRSARLANALMIRPVLKLKDGEIRIGRIYFGSRETSWKKYIASELGLMSQIDRRILFVTYVGLSRKELEVIRREIEKRGSFERVVFQKASPAIAANCGPGTFGVLFKEKC